MSTPSPDHAEGSEIPKTPSSGPADEPATEEPAAESPAAAEGTPAAEEPPPVPPTAELYVPPVVQEPVEQEPAHTTVIEEQAFVPGATEPPVTALEPEPAWAHLIRRATFGQGLVLVTGVLLFIWSFLPWYSDAGGSANAWSTVTIPGLVMTATWVPVLSLAIVVFVAIKIFGNGFPDKVLGFSWAQLSIVVGLFDVLITLGFLVANRSLGNLGSLDLGPGLILSFITSLLMLAGGIFDHLEVGSESFSRLRPPEARRDRDRS